MTTRDVPSSPTTGEPAQVRSASASVGLQFAFLALAWGASFLFIKVGLEGMSAGQVVLGRMVSGALTLVLISLVRRQRIPRDAALWGHLLVVAVLLCVVPYLLFAWAEGHISSGLASIYNATTPLMTMAVAMIALPDEPRTGDRLLGLVLGFAGVVVILSPWNGLGGSSLLGQLACLGATACYGVAFTYLRRFVSPRGLPAVTVATVQVGLGALVMVLLAPVVATGPMHLTWPVVACVVALGALGTGFAFVWNTNIVAAWGATSASTVTYLTPVVGVVLGALFLGEHLTWSEPLGALLVVIGIMASQGRLGRLTNPRRRR